MDRVRRLPRGRYALAPESVAEAQRDRLMTAMAEVMSEKGYVKTSVEDVIKRAVISRQSFYRHFTDKQDCFMAAFRRSTEALDQRIAAAAAGEGGPMERYERVVADFLQALVLDPAGARLCVTEVYAAGPAAVAHRDDFQQRLGDRIAAVLEASTVAGRFACQVIVAATSAMVAGPLASGDLDALRELGPPMVEHVRGLKAAGLI